MADEIQRPPGPITRLRRRLARFLLNFSSPEAASAVSPYNYGIDDGVDYSLPLVIPNGASADYREKAILAAVREAEATFHFQFDRPYRYAENLSQFPTVDPLSEWDAQTRAEIIARCHLAHERNPLANAAVSLTTMFTVGDGFHLTYRNQEVEAVIEEFVNDATNAIAGLEKSTSDDLQTDGEVFMRFHSGPDGRTAIVPLKPWEVLWIQHERGLPRRVEFFHWQGNTTTGVPGDSAFGQEDIPVDEIIHVAINRRSYELRGRPELFRILPWLKAYKDWLEGRARQNHWRGALLWAVTLIGGTAGQVAAKRAQYKQPPPPGSLVVSNDKEKWEPLSSTVGGADVAQDGRQIKLMTAVGMLLPEYMLSDGSNSNLASATAQQLPSLRKFVNLQDILVGELWEPVYRRVVENAIAAGVLPEVVPKQDEDGDPILDPLGQPNTIPAVEAFSVTASELESDDPKNLADALNIAVTRGWVSNETASGRMGFDYRMEQKKINSEEQANAELTAQGLRNPGPGIVPPVAQFQTQEQPTNGNIPQSN